MEKLTTLLHSPILWVMVILGVLIIWALGSYVVIRGIEEPEYNVILKTDTYEIREYEPYIVAETTVNTEDYERAMNEGFSRIAGYIFGDNTATQKISMTTPVIDSTDSEKIAMTTPVIDSGSADTRTVAFVMPRSYTLNTLPTPNDERVTLREVPAQTIAVHQYTWYTNADRISEKLDTLRTALREDGYTIVGDGQSARYNPPLSMPLLLRNEVWYTVAVPSNE